MHSTTESNAHVERLIGTLRRELLDRVLVWNEEQLRAVASEYVRWYNAGRVAPKILSLTQDRNTAQKIVKIVRPSPLLAMLAKTVPVACHPLLALRPSPLLLGGR